MEKYPAVKFKWWYCILYGLCAIIDGLTIILTLGYLDFGLQLKFALWGAMKKIYR